MRARIQFVTSARKTPNKNRHLLCVCVCVWHIVINLNKVKSTHTHLTTLVCALFNPRKILSSCISVISNVFPFLVLFAPLPHSYFLQFPLLTTPTPSYCTSRATGALQFVVVVVVVVALRHCCCCAAVICDSNWVSSKFYCLFSLALALSHALSLSFSLSLFE